MQTAVELYDVSFFYPGRDIDVEGETLRAVEDPTQVNRIFSGLTASLPATVMSLVGQNGIGKSTLLLLAGGRVFPHAGRVTVFGRDTVDFRAADLDPAVERERNRHVSFVYQNLEFESDQSVGDLLRIVGEDGFAPGRTDEILREARSVLELDAFMHRRTGQLSKGELQRTIVAFSMLYGSRMIMLDEPVFAMEDHQKQRALGFLVEYSHQYGVPVYYSVHDLELTERYSDYLLLFSRSGEFQIGPTRKLFTRKRIEEAYQAPWDTLHRRESLYRELLVRESTRRHR